MAKVRIVHMAWDRPFVDWSARFSLPSLMQPGNIPALVAAGHDVRVICYTVPHDMPAHLDAAHRLRATVEFAPFEVDAVANLRAVQTQLLLKFAEQCMREDAWAVVAGAGTIWSDGALANAFTVAQETDCAVAVMYLGIEAEKFTENLLIDPGLRTGISGAALASLAIEYLHPGSRSTLNRETSAAHLTGHGMMQLSSTLFAARFQVPSVAVVKFQPQDLALFRLEGDFRAWDGSHWVGSLIREGRYVFLASSDQAFQVNLIRAGKQNRAAYQALQAELGPYVDRRTAQRTTIQSDIARTFLASIRTDREVRFYA